MPAAPGPCGVSGDAAVNLLCCCISGWSFAASAEWREQEKLGGRHRDARLLLCLEGDWKCTWHTQFDVRKCGRLYLVQISHSVASKGGLKGVDLILLLVNPLLLHAVRASQGINLCIPALQWHNVASSVLGTYVCICVYVCIYASMCVCVVVVCVYVCVCARARTCMLVRERESRRREASLSFLQWTTQMNIQLF